MAHFYVRPGAADGGDGLTYTTAWNALKYVAPADHAPYGVRWDTAGTDPTAVGPGDTLHVCGNWFVDYYQHGFVYPQIRIGVNGTPGNPITIDGGYEIDHPELSATTGFTGQKTFLLRYWEKWHGSGWTAYDTSGFGIVGGTEPISPAYGAYYRSSSRNPYGASNLFAEYPADIDQATLYAINTASLNKLKRGKGPWVQVTPTTTASAKWHSHGVTSRIYCTGLTSFINDASSSTEGHLASNFVDQYLRLHDCPAGWTNGTYKVTAVGKDANGNYIDLDRACCAVGNETGGVGHVGMLPNKLWEAGMAITIKEDATSTVYYRPSAEVATINDATLFSMANMVISNGTSGNYGENFIYLAYINFSRLSMWGSGFCFDSSGTGSKEINIDQCEIRYGIAGDYAIELPGDHDGGSLTNSTIEYFDAGLYNYGSSAFATGTAEGGTATTLIDNEANFITSGVEVDDIIQFTSAGAGQYDVGEVAEVVSATTLRINANGWWPVGTLPAGRAYSIFKLKYGLRNWRIANNTIRYMTFAWGAPGHAGSFDGHGISFQRGSYVTIENNDVSYCGQAAICPYLGIYQNHIIIRNNWVHDHEAQVENVHNVLLPGEGDCSSNKIAIQPNSTSAGHLTGKRYDLYIYGNIIARAGARSTITTDECYTPGYDPEVIVNNTVSPSTIYDMYQTGAASPLHAADPETNLFRVTESLEAQAAYVIKNNAFFDVRDDQYFVQWIEGDDKADFGATAFEHIDWDYNLYYTTHLGTVPAWNLSGVHGHTFAEWQALTSPTPYYGADSWDANGLWADPLFANTSGTFANAADFTPLWNSPLIDAGTDITVEWDEAERTTDYLGNPIYGPPDIGAIEYQPPYEMGVDEVDIAANVRVYGDGMFRNTAAPSATTAKLTILPDNGTTRQYIDVAISAWTAVIKTWTETSPNHATYGVTGPVCHFVGGLQAKQAYYVHYHVDGGVEQGRVMRVANSAGYISFYHIGGYAGSVMAYTVDRATEQAETYTLFRP